MSNNIRYDLLNNRDWLYKKYVEEKLTQKEIGKLCNCSKFPILKKLKEYNIKRSKSISRSPKARWELINNKEWLYKKYIEDVLSTVEIAKICKCGHQTITRRLKTFDIEIRSIRESNNPKAKFNFLENKEWLEQKYVEEKLSTCEIAKICKCGNCLIGRKLKEFNIEIRSPSEVHNLNINWSLLNNKEWLKKKYTKEKLTIYQIAELCECSDTTVNDRLKNFNIPIIKRIGEDSPNWKGGISFEPYCNKFNNKLKEHIRDTFDRKCFLCGKSEEENNCKLHVHHVDYNKGQGCGYSWSLIPLCSSCHSKTNHNRYYWFNLLNNYWLLNPEINFYNIILYDHFFIK